MAGAKLRVELDAVMTTAGGTSEQADLLARFDRLQKWPWNWSLLAVVGFGFFFSFFDIITIGLSLKVLQEQFVVSQSTVNWAVTTSLLGYIFGSFLDSRISDRFGRRIGLYISVGLFTVGSILTATAWEFWMVLLWRFISGMGIGAEIAGVTTYMGEMSPRGARGRYTSIAVACGFFRLRRRALRRRAAGTELQLGLEGIVPARWPWRTCDLLHAPAHAGFTTVAAEPGTR